MTDGHPEGRPDARPDARTDWEQRIGRATKGSAAAFAGDAPRLDPRPASGPSRAGTR